MQLDRIIAELPPGAWLPAAALLRALAELLEHQARDHAARLAMRRLQRSADKTRSTWLAGGIVPALDDRSPEVRALARQRQSIKAKVLRNRKIIELAQAGLTNAKIGHAVKLSEDQVSRVLRQWLRVTAADGAATSDRP